MNVRIEKTAKAGEPAITKLFIDDRKMSFYSVASRLLTSTTCEDGSGIFEDAGSTKFCRGNATVDVYFAKDFSPAGMSVSEIRDEIKSRVRMVNEAFSEKYPAINESIEFEI